MTKYSSKYRGAWVPCTPAICLLPIVLIAIGAAVYEEYKKPAAEPKLPLTGTVIVCYTMIEDGMAMPNHERLDCTELRDGKVVKRTSERVYPEAKA